MSARTRAHRRVPKPLTCAIAELPMLLLDHAWIGIQKSQIPRSTPQVPSVARDRLQIGVWVLELGIWDLGMDGAKRFQLHGALARRRAAGANNSDHDREV